LLIRRTDSPNSSPSNGKQHGGWQAVLKFERENAVKPWHWTLATQKRIAEWASPSSKKVISNLRYNNTRQDAFNWGA